MKQIIRIGTRGSKLALWQANWVSNRLCAIHPNISTELVLIKTKGDKILDVPLARVGGKGLFVKEIEEAILDNRVDIAVHSMKDMPAEIPEGLCIGAIPEREDPTDVAITRTGDLLFNLPKGSKIGTSSLRRAAQLRHILPDMAIVPLRGNVDTRLAKLDAGVADAIILAAAGIKRLQVDHRPFQILSDDIMLPAVGQGALCIEIRKNDSKIQSLVSSLDHADTRAAVTGERAFLRTLEGGCQVPIAALGIVNGNDYILTGLISEPDGSFLIREQLSGLKQDSENIGIKLAKILLEKGAGHILEKFRADLHANK